MSMRAGLCFVMLLFSNHYSLGQNSLSVAVGKVLGAFERAHNAYDAAKESCGFRPVPLSAEPPKNGEVLLLNWSFVEKRTQKLAEKGPTASEAVRILGYLRDGRRALFEAYLECSRKHTSDADREAVRVGEEVTSLEVAGGELEELLFWKVWQLEEDSKIAREHPEFVCKAAQNK